MRAALVREPLKITENTEIAAEGKGANGEAFPSCVHSVSSVVEVSENDQNASGGRPVKRSIRLGIGGWVENRLASVSPPIMGATMKRCAVDGEAAIGSLFE